MINNEYALICAGIIAGIVDWYIFYNGQLMANRRRACPITEVKNNSESSIDTPYCNYS